MDRINKRLIFRCICPAGNPDIVNLDNKLVIEYDRIEYDYIEITDSNGRDLKPVSVPELEPLASTRNTEIAFSMPKIAGSKNVDYTIIIDADDYVRPKSDITLKIYDVDYYYDSRTKTIKAGWEDEYHRDIGETTEPSATIYIGKEDCVFDSDCRDSYWSRGSQQFMREGNCINNECIYTDIEIECNPLLKYPEEYCCKLVSGNWKLLKGDDC